MRKISLTDLVRLSVQASSCFMSIPREEMDRRPFGQESMMPRAMAIVTA
jgi:hypothetical protein